MEPITPTLIDALLCFLVASALFLLSAVGLELEKWRERKKKKVEKL